MAASIGAAALATAGPALAEKEWLDGGRYPDGATCWASYFDTVTLEIGYRIWDCTPSILDRHDEIEGILL
jgi:hypothetical protein